MAEIWVLRGKQKIFLLDFLNRVSCKNRNGVMLVNILFKIFSQFFKIRVECPFKLFRFDRTNFLLGMAFPIKNSARFADSKQYFHKLTHIPNSQRFVTALLSKQSKRSASQIQSFSSKTLFDFLNFNLQSQR